MSFRVAYVVAHPIQYQASLFRYLSYAGGIDLRVFFLSDFSLHEHYEPAFKQIFKWDTVLPDGGQWQILPQIFSRASTALRPWWPAARLRRCWREGLFDAVWVQGWEHLGLCQVMRDATSIGLPVLLRGESAPELNPSLTVRRRFRDAVCLQWLLPRIAGFLCTGTRDRNFYRRYQVPEERLFSVPYAVDNGFFQARCAEAGRQREIFRRSLGLQPGRPVILFVGKFVTAKAPDELLAAFKQVHGRLNGSAAPYLLYLGDGPLRNAMEAQAKPLGDAVRFLGFRNQSELPAIYDLCDVFVLPSRLEPWGLALNEAMNAARTVIVSDRVGAHPDLVANGENGFVYTSGDAAALVARLLQVLQSPRRRTSMGEGSLRRISSWDFAADRQGLLEALSKVCQKRVAAA